MRAPGVRIGLAALLLLLGAPLARAHPVHSSLAEVREDAAAGEVVVVLRVFASDLAVAVATAGAPAPEPCCIPAAAAAAYVARTFQLVDGTGRRLAPRWAGSRQTGDLLWITLRAAAPAGMRGLRVLDRVLVERFPDQVNLLQVVDGGARRTILFTRGDSWKPASVSGGA